MGFLKKLLGGVVKTGVGVIGTTVNAVDETISGDLEYEGTADSAETMVDGVEDIITSPFSIFDDEDE